MLRIHRAYAMLPYCIPAYMGRPFCLHQLVIKHVEYAGAVQLPRFEPAAVVDDDRVRAHPVEIDRLCKQLRIVQCKDAGAAQCSAR